jgi:NarL family two-component system response regulator LiaR
LESLTEHEWKILKLLADGLSNADIAKAMVITPKTVAYHITNIFEKLEVRSRHEAAAWAHKHLPDNLE